MKKADFIKGVISSEIQITQKPVRVAHVIGSVCKGGVESVVFGYYRAIDKTKVQFDFIIDEDSPDEIPADVVAMGCRVYEIPSYRCLPDYIKKLTKIYTENNYQFVHSHVNTLSVFAMFAAKRARVPVRIAHSHSTAGKGEFARNVMKYTLRPLSRLFPTHLFACSEYAGRWLFGNRTFEKGGVTVVRNAIDTAKFAFSPEIRERVRHELELGGRFVLGHVGRFVPQKNHLYLIDIFAEVRKRKPNSVLLLVGEGELRMAVEEKVRRSGLSDSVMFLGVRDDVEELYQAMDIFVLPSLYEGLPVVGVEAQCSGMPCVFSSRMTKESIINTKSVMLSLDSNVEIWANEIVNNATNSVERDNASRSDSVVWDIHSGAKLLSEKYLAAALCANL